jgi:ABC-type antimicrobial peptide transport system permease subunit
MRDAVHAFDSDVPVRQVTTLPALISDSAARERYRTFLMGVFGALATLLAAVGIGGVTARGVAHRTKELGVRMCLGAEDRSLAGMILTDGLITGLLGTLAGLLVAAWAGRALSGLLFGVAPFDPVTYSAVAGLLLLVVGASSYLPARRIAKLDPAEVLREG